MPTGPGLSDRCAQFVSESMKEVTRLLSIKQLTTTPCHPMCNGLTEKFNGTMKSMLKRLCSEQPRQWHRYINPLLFAYREVPQESTGFLPFELLYRTGFRGPMFILKELWMKKLQEPEVKFELHEKLEDTLKLVHTELQKVPFVLQTDHEPLKYMNSAKFANECLMYWAMFL